MSKNMPRMTAQDGRYGVHLRSIIFPIDFRDLCRILARNGYELAATSDVPPPPARVRFGGEIARKGDARVVAESDSQEIGCVSRSVQDAYSSFDALAKLASSELGVDLNENVRFYWVIAHYRIGTDKVPLKEIAKTENKEYSGRFAEILGQNLSQYSIRLTLKDAIPNQENWFDISIEPDIYNEKIYHAGAVFRDPSRERAEAFAKSIESKLSKLIEAIEA